MNSPEKQQKNNSRQPSKQFSTFKPTSESLFPEQSKLIDVPSGGDSTDVLSVKTLSSLISIKSTYMFKRKLSFKIMRFSITLFFIDYFLIFQPYNTSISKYAANPHYGVKLTVTFFLVFAIFASSFCMLKVYKDCKQMIRYKNNIRYRCKKGIEISALVITIITQSLFIAHLFMNRVIQYLTPIFLSLSCFIWMINCCFSQYPQWAKIFFSLFFLVEALGAVAVLFEALNTTTLGINHHFWMKHFLPIMLITNIIFATFNTIGPCVFGYNTEITSNQNNFRF